MSAARTVTVALGERSYDILVGEGLLAAAGAHIRTLAGATPVAVVSDDAVAPLYLGEVMASLRAADLPAVEIQVPAGEHSKSFEQLQELIARLLDAGIARDWTVVALGGGVVGDLAGFAASIVLRGVDLVQLPTTLLAQVDSAVGGKTGINTRFGKNLVGSFHQPRLVLADILTLESLPRRDLLAGYAEVVKYGLIGDAAFFAWLEANGRGIIEGDRGARAHAVATCCAAKARVVAADEREGGARALLNFGHTFGHALEAEAGFGPDLLHGEAVAIGMVMAFALSVRLGFCPAEDLARVHRHFAAVGLPTAPPSLAGRQWRAERLLDHIGHDKKVRAGRPALVLVRAIGEAFVHREARRDQLLEMLADSLAA